MKINSLLLADYYKVGHIFDYPEGTEFVYSNFTPRKSRIPEIQEMVFFGLQYFIKAYLIDHFNENFFSKTKEEVVRSYSRRMRTSLGYDLPSYKHIEELHDLGYLPLKIKALPEGALVPMGVPCVTITNTLPEFFWLTNYIETILSATIWQPSTSATLAYEFRKIFNKYAEETGMPKEFLKWQGHNFSFRGISSFESAMTCDNGHLLSFAGTDTIPGIDGMEYYYNANAETELIGGSVAASEHSCVSAGQKENEFETLKRLITKIHPNGIYSFISDTWNIWTVLTQYLPALKKEILARDGKLVIRPDSGDPVKIICGDPNGKTIEEKKGVIELLWDTFGGTITPKGYKLLDSHIGAILGDGVTLDRAKRINEGLKAKGFASQMVLGIGSYSYQYVTRDIFGSAIKATYVTIKGQHFNVFKDPITDDGLKKSAKGLLKVEKNEQGKYILRDEVSIVAESQGELQTVFENGKFVKRTTLQEIRERLHGDKF